MARPTRQERLASAAAAARAKIVAEQRKLASLQSAQREEERKVRDRRRYQVGALAEECGLCGLDDAVLRPLFAALQVLSAVPNPVALMEGLIEDVSSSPGKIVPGCATPAECDVPT